MAVSKVDTGKHCDDNGPKQSSKDTTSRPGGKRAKPANGPPAEPADAMQETSGIPKFDLAEQIMAEQRKIAAIRRRGPGKKAEAPKQQRKVESIAYTVEPPPILSEQEQIVAEIVAGDIEKLCKDNASRLRR
jgi:hypothetical protein